MQFSPAILRAIRVLDGALVADSTFPIHSGHGPPVGRDGSLLFLRTGLLGGGPAGRELQREINVPVEAFPFLDHGIDGCHHALWIDDPLADVVPPVVEIVPSDPTPQTVQLVADSAEDFLSLVRAVGSFAGRRGDHAEVYRDHRQRALARRSRMARHPTADGMGVVVPDERSRGHVEREAQMGWAAQGGSPGFHGAIDALLADGRPGLALAACRDLVAHGAVRSIDGFAERCADVYRALRRASLADIAMGSYR